MNMNDNLKGKYKTDRPQMGYPAKARTGNSLGPAKGNLPARVPCKRAPAGPGAFKADVSAAVGHKVMHVDGRTGHKVMRDS